MALHSTSGALTLTAADGILITNNLALTGTVTVATVGSTQYGTAGATIAVITNPTVGSMYRYGGLSRQGNVTVTPSTTCDISVTALTNTQV